MVRWLREKSAILQFPLSYYSPPFAAIFVVFKNAILSLSIYLCMLVIMFFLCFSHSTTHFSRKLAHLRHCFQITLKTVPIKRWMQLSHINVLNASFRYPTPNTEFAYEKFPNINHIGYGECWKFEFIAINKTNISGLSGRFLVILRMSRFSLKK